MAIESLYTKVTNIEKKQKALNFYVNFAESFQAEHSSKTEEWTTRFYNKNLRIEMTGLLTDNLYYRFRHRLNKTASATKDEKFKNYRTAYGYIGSLEYYPARKQKQDLRFFLAYVSRKYDYSKKCGLKDYNTDRIELGMMYRLKAY